MATEFIETEAPTDDLEGRILEAVAGDDADYVMVVMTQDDDGGFNLRVATSFGSTGTAKALLARAARELP